MQLPEKYKETFDVSSQAASGVTNGRALVPRPLSTPIARFCI
jgi:hypothetical protein